MTKDTRTWEKELLRLASLVGTDARTPEKNLISLVNNIIDQARKEEKERIIRLIERLKIDERNTRTYKNWENGEECDAETYNDKILVNAVYSHLNRLIDAV